jgi:ADP-heptose:LPS heptosyltransferase
MNRRAVIVRTDHLGDALLTTPLIRALAHGGYEVDFILPEPFLPLLASNPHLSGCLPLDPGWKRNWMELARTLRRGDYDLLILPFAVAWQLKVAGLLSGIPERIAMWGGLLGRLTGYTCLRSGFLTSPRPYAEILLDIARFLKLPSDGIALDLAVERRGPKGKVPRVGIHPGSGGSACNLAPEAYGELAGLILAETDWEVVVTGTPSETRLLEGWPDAVLASPRLHNRVGALSLPALAEAVAGFDLLIVSSTGPLHIAAALGVPTVSPFCPRLTVGPRVWGNQNPNGYAVLGPAEKCLSVPEGVKCDFSGKVSPRRIFEACLGILANGSKSS